MEKFIRTIDRLSNTFGIISGVLIILGMVLVLAEIFAREVLHTTIYISGEYSGYFMVSITFLGLAYTLKEKGHIRMTFLHKLKVFQSGKPRIYLDIYSFIIGFTVFIIITYITGSFVWDSVVTGTQSMQMGRTYIAIPQFAMPIGSFIITLQFFSEILQTLKKLREGKIEEHDFKIEDEALGR
jgi:TRAP-type C4-dicarboxylate transport system permease small subunit